MVSSIVKQGLEFQELFSHLFEQWICGVNQRHICELRGEIVPSWAFVNSARRENGNQGIRNESWKSWQNHFHVQFTHSLNDFHSQYTLLSEPFHWHWTSVSLYISHPLPGLESRSSEEIQNILFFQTHSQINLQPNILLSNLH
jgi:hypothetical protein